VSRKSTLGDDGSARTEEKHPWVLFEVRRTWLESREVLRTAENPSAARIF
jgi:hypothetical protein